MGRGDDQEQDWSASRMGHGQKAPTIKSTEDRFFSIYEQTPCEVGELSPRFVMRRGSVILAKVSAPSGHVTQNESKPTCKTTFPSGKVFAWQNPSASLSNSASTVRDSLLMSVLNLDY